MKQWKNGKKMFKMREKNEKNIKMKWNNDEKNVKMEWKKSRNVYNGDKQRWEK